MAAVKTEADTTGQGNVTAAEEEEDKLYAAVAAAAAAAADDDDDDDADRADDDETLDVEGVKVGRVLRVRVVGGRGNDESSVSVARPLSPNRCRACRVTYFGASNGASPGV